MNCPRARRYLIISLIRKGVDKKHPYALVIVKVQELLNSDWLVHMSHIFKGGTALLIAWLIWIILSNLELVFILFLLAVFVLFCSPTRAFI